MGQKASLLLQRIKDTRLCQLSREAGVPAAGQGGALTVSSCLMHSMVASSALVPRVASSSTAFTVFRRDVTFVTITCRMNTDAHIQTRRGRSFSSAAKKKKDPDKYNCLYSGFACIYLFIFFAHLIEIKLLNCIIYFQSYSLFREI